MIKFLILFISLFSFSLNVHADEGLSDNLEPNKAIFRMAYCKSQGGCQTSENFSLTSPNYPIFSEFSFTYSGVAGYNQPLHSSHFACHKTSFRIKAPDDARGIQNYNNLNYWKYDDSSFSIRYLDFRLSQGYYYYDFYVQANPNLLEYSRISEKFTYTGNINPYVTDYDYSSQASWISTTYVHCDSINDVMTGNEFDAVNDRIDGMQSSINSNIDELKEKQEEQNQTSKGIWATLTDGLGNIGKWFTDLASSIGNFFKELGEGIANGFSNLFDGIKSFFVGDEVCEVVEQNYFTGYDYVNNTANRIAPDENGWITLSLKSNGSGNIYTSSLKSDFDTSKIYNVFVEFSDYSSNCRGYFIPIFQTSNQLIGDSSSRVWLDDFTFSNSTWTKKGNLFNFHVSSHEVSTYFLQSLLSNWNNGTSSITFRMLITDDMSMTVDNYQYVDKEETCTNVGGLFGMLTSFFKSVGDFFSNLFSFMGDDSGPDVSGLGNTAGWLPAGPVDSLVNLPLTLFSNLSTALGSACTPVVLPLPFVHKNIELPCLNQIYSKISGLSAWITSIGFIAAAFILYTYLLNLYKWVDDTLTMRENTWDDVDSWGGI